VWNVELQKKQLLYKTSDYLCVTIVHVPEVTVINVPLASCILSNFKLVLDFLLQHIIIALIFFTPDAFIVFVCLSVLPLLEADIAESWRAIGGYSEKTVRFPPCSSLLALNTKLPLCAYLHSHVVWFSDA